MIETIKIKNYEIHDTISRWECRLDHPTGYSQYPIIYDNGKIAYDWPEIVPEYVKREVEKFLRKKVEQNGQA